MNTTVTYIIDKMRVTRPGAKTQERNPERLYTVSGTFWSTKLDEKGRLIRNEKLAIPSKNIDRDDVSAEGFALDVTNGILSLPEGRRGRTAAEGLTQDEILAELAALRGEPDPSESDES